ncbi:hypothetical protein ACTXN8_11325, partial [Pseudomonas helleri]|uniref:hypothetical protein n=1 Tax=Pseudomonas helleri TaxID=1608996 RepID=UPI003FD6B8EB
KGFDTRIKRVGARLPRDLLNDQKIARQARSYSFVDTAPLVCISPHFCALHTPKPLACSTQHTRPTRKSPGFRGFCVYAKKITAKKQNWHAPCNNPVT